MTAPTTIHVQIARIPGNDDVPLPAYQSPDAAGMDLHAAVIEDTVIATGAVAMIPCGIRIALPPHHEAQVRPRSGLASRHSISMPNAPGTIDADYRGEVCVLLINHGDVPFTVTRGMRIAQMLVKPVPRVAWEEVDDLSDTLRGAGGFGHTGQ